jgi:hypothetical protein
MATIGDQIRHPIQTIANLWGSSYEKAHQEQWNGRLHPGVDAVKFVANLNHDSRVGSVFPVNYAQFMEEYAEDKSSKWIGRKVFAIPAAGVACYKAIAHIIQTVFSLLKIIVPGGLANTKICAAQVYRDLEEGVGHLVTVFDDASGSFLVEKALCYKKYYQIQIEKGSAFKNAELNKSLAILQSAARQCGWS